MKRKLAGFICIMCLLCSTVMVITSCGGSGSSQGGATAMDCPTCSGAGKVFNATSGQYETCKTCGGDGKVMDGN